MGMKETFIDRGRWYYTLTIGTGGAAAWISFLHAATALPLIAVLQLRPLRRAIWEGGPVPMRSGWDPVAHRSA